MRVWVSVCVCVCGIAGIMDECCRNECAGSVLQGRSISTIHSSLITTLELRGDLSLFLLPAPLLSFTISPYSPSRDRPPWSYYRSFSLRLSVCFQVLHISALFIGIKEMKMFCPTTLVWYISYKPIFSHLQCLLLFVIVLCVYLWNKTLLSCLPFIYYPFYNLWTKNIKTKISHSAIWPFVPFCPSSQDSSESIASQRWQLSCFMTIFDWFRPHSSFSSCQCWV